MTEDLWTAEEAAAEVGVAKQTIYVWVARGYLTHAGKRGKYKLFKLSDVLEAEKSRSHQHRKRSERC